MKTCLTIATLSLGAAACRAQPCSPYWAGPTPSGSPTIIRALAEFDDGTGKALYAAGNFWEFQGVWIRRESVWRLCGSQWEPVGAGQLIGAGRRLLVLDDGTGEKLYTEGHTSSPTVWWFKRWNGASWVDGPPGFWNNTTSPRFYPEHSGLFIGGPTIFGVRVEAGGHFRYVTKWLGSSWQPLGGPIESFGSHPSAFEIYDHGAGPRLYVGGNYNTISGVQAHGIAAWDGQQWHSLGTTSEFRPGLIRDLCVYDDGSGPRLYVASMQPWPAIPPFDGCIVSWDGSQWSSVGRGVTIAPGGWSPQVTAMAVFDDGSGPALFVTGGFDHAGGVPAPGIAKWNGKQWVAVGARLGTYVESMAAYTDTRGPSLFVGGDFGTVNSAWSQGLGQYVGCPNCYANCDLSTTAPTLNIADFTCFLRHFAASSPYANCDNSTGTPALDVADFVCFMQKFAAGCP
jgi:trimeric autotransporter adhesin